MDDAQRAGEELARIRDGKPPLARELPTAETWRSVRDSTAFWKGRSIIDLAIAELLKIIRSWQDLVDIRDGRALHAFGGLLAR